MPQTVTLIILAVLAAVVLYQLYAVLGRRVGRQPEDVEGYRRFLDYSAGVFHEGYEKLGAVPFLDFKSMLSAAPTLVRYQAWRSVYSIVSTFVRNEKLRQALSFHTLLVGGNPMTTSAIYALIHKLERDGGVAHRPLAVLLASAATLQLYVANYTSTYRAIPLSVALATAWAAGHRRWSLLVAAWFVIAPLAYALSPLSQDTRTPLTLLGDAVSNAAMFAAVLVLGEAVRSRQALDREHRLLLAEQERSERLLLNVLPASIADRPRICCR